MSEKKYRLIPETVPPSGRTTEKYAEPVREFLESGEKSVKIELPNVHYTSAYCGLSSWLRKHGETRVKVSMRNTSLYLVRQDI